MTDDACGSGFLCLSGVCSAAGGGVAGGGGGVTGGGGGGPDAGCGLFMCPEIDWTSTLSSVGGIVAPALMTASLTDFRIYASFDTAYSPNAIVHYEIRFLDGGVTQTFRSVLGARTEARQVRGVSMTDYVVTTRVAAVHFEGDFATFLPSCTTADGGSNDPWYFAVAPVSADEMWLVGSPMTICHWTRLGGAIEMVDPTPWPDVTLNDIYRTPSGTTYAVGSNRIATDVAKGIIFRGDGSQVTAPDHIDSNYAAAFNSIDGTGEAVYVLGRSNAMGHGEILALQGDGGFGVVYTAPFTLSQLDVTPDGRVWAVGEAPGAAVHFDGGSWGLVGLPTTENRPDVSWENINATSDGLVLSGSELQRDGGRAAIVNTYRFGP